MSNLKKRIKHIFDPIFTQNYYFIRAETLKEYHKVLFDEFNYIADDRSEITGKFRVIMKKGQDIGVIWAPVNRIDILVHECSHAVIWALSRRGIVITDSEEETFCYVLQFLVKEILSCRIDKRICVRIAKMGK